MARRIKRRIDLGHQKEKLVEKIINKLRRNRQWIVEAKQSPPGEKEDGEGKDVIVYTTYGEFYIQVKSCASSAEHFIKDKRHSKRYKKMYVVEYPSESKIICREMPSPDQDANAFIVILIIFRKQKKINQKTDRIEDISFVFKKVQITLDIIKKHIDDMK